MGWSPRGCPPRPDQPGRPEPRSRMPRSQAGLRSHTKHQRSRRGTDPRAAHRSSRPRATLIVTSQEGPGYPSRAPTEPRSPSSRGLGRRPFKAEARVRIPLGARGRRFGADAQPHICACGGVRSSSSPCQGEDRGIEARQARYLSSGILPMRSLASGLAAILAATPRSASISPSSRTTFRRSSPSPIDAYTPAALFLTTTRRTGTLLLPRPRAARCWLDTRTVVTTRSFTGR
jgi:hypothetical protein